MNVYDSEKIEGMLQAQGYTPTPFLDTADVIIMNTCTVREKAEQKAFSFLGRLADLKRSNPNLILGVCGCMAQQEGRRILSRMPHIDFVFGTRAISRLPDTLKRVMEQRCRVVDIEMATEGDTSVSNVALKENGGISRFVTIMRGCDNYCSYCVVPYVRGEETSRHPDRILEEIRSLVNNGVREVTLLGQNVNSYGKKEGLCSFAELLFRANDIEGLYRIRFTTSHPKDLSDDLIQAFGDVEKLCNHIHLPVQSGSNRILKRMNRKYSRETYLRKIEKLRSVCPDIAITTDIIVGFPGETRQDFQETLQLINLIEYDSLFAFKYSDRSNAPAALFPDKVGENEKKDRLTQVLKLHKQISGRRNQALVGSVQTVLVDGQSKRNKKLETLQWTGRVSTNKIVNFTDNSEEGTAADLIGCLVPVRIEKALAHSLRGKPIDLGDAACGLKGVDDYVAKSDNSGHDDGSFLKYTDHHP